MADYDVKDFSMHARSISSLAAFDMTSMARHCFYVL